MKFKPIYLLLPITVILLIFNIQLFDLVKQQKAIIDNNQDNINKLLEYKEAIRLSDIIFDNNNIWDKDNSDVMSDYLNLRANMDTTFYKAFHRNNLLDSLSLDYNE